MKRASVGVLAFVLMAGLATSGCFKSSTSQASSESSSKSSSSPFRSSSPDDDEESAYERDIRDYTVAHATSVRDLGRFEKDLADIAEGYGISDWEGDRVTHVAVGRGLARIGLAMTEADTLAIALVRSDPTRARWVLGGYRAARPE